MMENSFIKGIFNQGKEADQVLSRSLLQKEFLFISGNFRMELSMEKASSLMMMELGMRDNGRKEKSMASEN